MRYRVLVEYDIEADSADRAVAAVVNLCPDEALFGDPVWGMQVLVSSEGQGVSEVTDRWPSQWPKVRNRPPRR